MDPGRTTEIQRLMQRPVCLSLRQVSLPDIDLFFMNTGEHDRLIFKKLCLLFTLLTQWTSINLFIHSSDCCDLVNCDHKLCAD